MSSRWIVLSRGRRHRWAIISREAPFRFHFNKHDLPTGSSEFEERMEWDDREVAQKEENEEVCNLFQGKIEMEFSQTRIAFQLDLIWYSKGINWQKNLLLCKADSWNLLRNCIHSSRTFSFPPNAQVPLTSFNLKWNFILLLGLGEWKVIHEKRWRRSRRRAGASSWFRMKNLITFLQICLALRAACEMEFNIKGNKIKGENIESERRKRIEAQVVGCRLKHRTSTNWHMTQCGRNFRLGESDLTLCSVMRCQAGATFARETLLLALAF